MAKGYKMTPAEIVPGKSSKAGGGLYSRAVDEFVKSGLNAVKLEFAGKTVKSAQVGLIVAIRNSGVDGLRATIRGGELYLIKEES